MTELQSPPNQSLYSFPSLTRMKDCTSHSPPPIHARMPQAQPHSNSVDTGIGDRTRKQDAYTSNRPMIKTTAKITRRKNTKTTNLTETKASPKPPLRTPRFTVPTACETKSHTTTSTPNHPPRHDLLLQDPEHRDPLALIGSVSQNSASWASSPLLECTNTATHRNSIQQNMVKRQRR